MKYQTPAELPIGSSAYTWRPIHPGDISAIQQMLADNRKFEKVSEGFSKESLKQILGLLDDQVTQNTLIAVAENATIAALAMVLIPPSEEEYIALFDSHVHVYHRQQGLESFLLEWMEARIRQAFSNLDNAQPQIMRTSCEGYQKDQIALLEQNGFQAVRYSYKMVRSLKQPIQEAPLPRELRWTQWTTELDSALMDAFNEAFHGHWGVPKMETEMWQKFFTGVPQFRGDLTYLATEKNTIIGFCVNWVNEVVQQEKIVKQGWVEAIGVVPEWRGFGIASALLTHSLHLFKNEGLSQAALDVDAQNPTGALRLYEKYGFKVAKENIHFIKKLN